MNKITKYIFLAILFMISGCSQDSSEDTIVFATSADYPPFEYIEDGKIKGFDIELATAVANELGKEAEFKDIQFSSIFPALNNGIVDAAISTISITEDRAKNFELSDPYYIEGLVMVFHKNKPITNKSEITNQKIACQLGTIMEFWLRKNAPNVTIITTDNNPQAIEALKSGLVDGVFVDAVQGDAFISKDKRLASVFITKADAGYGIALKKGSPLIKSINDAIETLREKGVIQELKDKYLKSKQWKN